MEFKVKKEFRIGRISRKAVRHRTLWCGNAEEDGYVADYEGKGRISLGRIIRIWFVRLVIQLLSYSFAI